MPPVADIHTIEKQELIKLCEAFIGRGWKKKLAQRACINPSAVSNWVNGKTQNSFKADREARRMLIEEKEIRKRFPNRV